jgi:hypothetical protein
MGWVVNATSRPLYPREKPGTHCLGGWVDPRAGLDGCGKSQLPPGFDPRTAQLLAIPTALSQPTPLQYHMHINFPCYCLSYWHEEARIAQLIWSLNYGFGNQGVVVRFPSQVKQIFFSSTLRPSLRPIQPSIQWAEGESFAWGKTTPTYFQKNGMQNTALSQKHTKERQKHHFSYTNTVILLPRRNSCTIVRTF